jgi:hypothetical protein
MQKDQIKLAGIIAGTIFVMAGVAFALSSGDGWRTTAVEGYEELAQCITDSGAKFYAAFWCPYCQEQKRVFGRGGNILPYIECSTPNGQGQLSTCADAEITSYPTWEFADGVRLTGALAPRSLAQITGCPYPYDDTDVEEATDEPTETSPVVNLEPTPEE